MREPKPQQRRERFSLKDVPPLITAIAALITALVAAAAFFAGRATTVKSGTAASPTAPAHKQSVGSKDTSSPTGSTVTPASTVRWGPGIVRVDAVELDPIPPQAGAGASGDVGFNEINSDPGIYGINGKVALWTGSAKPDASQCTSLVETQGTEGGAGVPVKKGSIVCAITVHGRPAMLVVTEATSADMAGEFLFANVTVWQ